MQFERRNKPLRKRHIFHRIEIIFQLRRQNPYDLVGDHFGCFLIVDNFYTRTTVFLCCMQGKLSLALQHTTRLTALKGKLEITADLKRAKAMAETFIHSGDTCVICDSVETNMIRYYKTVAEMFFAEPKFKETLLGTNGFCLEHFGYLLKYAAYARGKKKDYVYTLTKLQKESMDALLADLQWFCAKHDYRNADKPWNGADTALLRSVEKLHGETADEAPKK